MPRDNHFFNISLLNILEFELLGFFVSLKLSSRVLPFLNVLFLFYLLPLSANANNFDVYCTVNRDGTTTCSGWQGDEDLTCVSNAGGSLSCQSSSGQRVVCVNEFGTTSCLDEDSDQSRTTQCILDGGGTASCAQQNENSAPLIEAPSITPPSIQEPDNLLSPTLIIPSVF